MEVAVSAFRSELKTWLALVQGGQEVVLTERGVPVAKVVPVDRATAIDQLTRDGVISAPRSAHRPRATGGSRPAARGSTGARPVGEVVTHNRRDVR